MFIDAPVRSHAMANGIAGTGQAGPFACPACNRPGAMFEGQFLIAREVASFSQPGLLRGIGNQRACSGMPACCVVITLIALPGAKKSARVLRADFRRRTGVTVTDWYWRCRR